MNTVELLEVLGGGEILLEIEKGYRVQCGVNNNF